jgi:hypothetical protein
MQEKGGIIEWIPNVATLGDCIPAASSTDADTLRNQYKGQVLKFFKA